MRQQEETVGDGQKEQVDARRMHAETLLRKHVNGEPVANEPDEDDEYGADNVDFARECVVLMFPGRSLDRCGLR